MHSREQTRFWQASALSGVELLQARYLEQRFAPHVHEGFVFTVIEHGAQRFHHRGCDHLAPQGSMVLINPDEVHTGSKAHEDGWRYRGFYPDNAQVLGALQELGLAKAGMPSFSFSVLHDPRLHAAFLQLHQLLEHGAEALQQQLAWREAILLLFQHQGVVVGIICADLQVQHFTGTHRFRQCAGVLNHWCGVGRAVGRSDIEQLEAQASFVVDCNGPQGVGL